MLATGEAEEGRFIVFFLCRLRCNSRELGGHVEAMERRPAEVPAISVSVHLTQALAYQTGVGIIGQIVARQRYSIAKMPATTEAAAT